MRDFYRKILGWKKNVLVGVIRGRGRIMSKIDGVDRFMWYGQGNTQQNHLVCQGDVQPEGFFGSLMGITRKRCRSQVANGNQFIFTSVISINELVWRADFLFSFKAR